MMGLMSNRYRSPEGSWTWTVNSFLFTFVLPDPSILLSTKGFHIHLLEGGRAEWKKTGDTPMVALSVNVYEISLWWAFSIEFCAFVSITLVDISSWHEVKEGDCFLGLAFIYLEVWTGTVMSKWPCLLLIALKGWHNIHLELYYQIDIHWESYTAVGRMLELYKTGHSLLPCS